MRGEQFLLTFLTGLAVGLLFGGAMMESSIGDDCQKLHGFTQQGAVYTCERVHRDSP